MHNTRRKRKKLNREEMQLSYHCRFVTGTTKHFVVDDDRMENVESVSKGNEIKTFYEDLVNESRKTTSTAAKHHSHNHPKSNKDLKRKTTNNTNLDMLSVKKFIATLFRLCAIDNKLLELKTHLNTIKERPDYKTILNASDQYGWTAIMCAAAEGYLDVVKFLVSEGATYDGITDKSGCDVFEICEKRQQWHVKEYLLGLSRNKQTFSTSVQSKRKTFKTRRKSEDEPIQCTLCGVGYKMHEQKQHESSTIHLFKDKTRHVNTNSLVISDQNVGFRMMLRSGWEVDEGLGPSGSGRKNPIKTVLKQDRGGLGLVENQIRRVSHFKPFDEAAVNKLKRENDKNKLKQTRTIPKTQPYKTNKKDKNWERNMRRYMSSDY